MRRISIDGEAELGRSVRPPPSSVRARCEHMFVLRAATWIGRRCGCCSSRASRSSGSPTRFRRHPSTVAYWIAKHGLEANGHEKHAAKGGLDREVLATLVAQGATIREIAAAVDRSAGTVRHWLGRYGLKTQNRRGPRTGDEVEAARERLAHRDASMRDPRHHTVRPGSGRLLPMPAVPIRGGHPSPAKGQTDPRRRSRRIVPAVRLRPLPRCAGLPSPRPVDQADRGQRQRVRPRHRQAARRRRQVRAAVRELSCRS